MESGSLKEQTKELLSYLEEIETIFRDVKEKGEGKDFFTVVKPYAEKVSKRLDEWKKEGQEWIRRESPQNFHQKQIEAVYDQLELLSVQAFYPTTSKKRFFDYYRTVRYNLLTLIELLETKKRTSN